MKQALAVPRLPRRQQQQPPLYLKRLSNKVCNSQKTPIGKHRISRAVDCACLSHNNTYRHRRGQQCTPTWSRALRMVSATYQPPRLAMKFSAGCACRERPFKACTPSATALQQFAQGDNRKVHHVSPAGLQSVCCALAIVCMTGSVAQRRSSRRLVLRQ